MSKRLLCLALLAFAALSLGPVGVMLARVRPEDLSELFGERGMGLLGRTLRLAGASTGIALVLGAPFGFLVARTDVPGRSAMRMLGLVPLILPPILLAMTWTVFAQQWPGYPSAVCVLGLSTFPLVSLFTARAAERIDGRREEAALLLGGLRAVLRVDLPLILPASLCGAVLAFTFAINDFAVTDYVTFVGRKYTVYAAEVFMNWRQTKSPGLAVASALPLIGLAMAALLPLLALRRRGALRSLGGDFVAPAPLALGRWRWPAFAFCLAVVSAGALLPIGQLAWEATGGPRILRDPEGARGLALLPELGRGLLENLRRSLQLAQSDLRNSVVLSAAAASICVPVGLVLGHAIERSRRRLLAVGLEALALLPLAAPAVLFGIGFISVWNHDWSSAFYADPGLSSALFAGRFLPFAILSLSAACASLSPRLEEAAALAGARPARRLFSVVGPSLSSSCWAAWILVFVFSMRELDAAILVQSANSTAVFRLFNQVHFGRDANVAALSLILIYAILMPCLSWAVLSKKRLEVLP